MTTSLGLRVSIFTTMPPGVYSGGRYLSLILAHALARAGADVTYVTNNAPLFTRDFEDFEENWPVDTIVSADFELPAGLVSDWVVVIPTGGFNSRFYDAALEHARASGARVALLSFETPNWYADLSPYPRSPMPTESWRQVVANGGLVVTIAEEGVSPARAYFGGDRQDLVFGHWHPPVNDLAAQKARRSLDDPGQADRRRIVMFTRIEDPHKGAQDLFSLPPKLFDGHILSLVFGRGTPEAFVDDLRRHFASARDFALEVHVQITDEQKFRLLGQSRLLLFPSYFEGFGYPPVEAAEMGVPSVAYDLPLLREVAGQAVRLVPKGDTKAFAEAIAQALAEPLTSIGASVRAKLRHDPGTLAAGERMLRLFEEAMHLPPASSPPLIVPVPAVSSSGAPALPSFLSRIVAGPRLVDIDGEIVARRVMLSGRVVGAPKGAMLRFDMQGCRIADVVLGEADPDGHAAFSISGSVDEWIEHPQSPGRARLDVLLLQSGATPAKLGYHQIAPDWATLLLWPDGANRVPAVENRFPAVTVILRPEALVLHRGASSSLAAVCDTLDRMRRFSRVLILSDAPSPVSLTDLDLELLPRFHGAETIAVDEAKHLFADAVAAGQPVILGPGLEDLLPNGAECLHFLGTGEAEREHIWLSVCGGASGSVRIPPDPRRSRRTLADRERNVTLVLVPSARMNGLCFATAKLLKRIEVSCDILDVVVPGRLWTASAEATFGVSGFVRPVPEAELSLLAAGAGRCIGLVPDGEGGDAVTLRLLATSARPIFEVFDGGPSSLSDVLDVLTGDLNACPVGRVVADVFESAPVPALPRTPRGNSHLPQRRAAQPPVLGPEGRLSFSSTLLEEPNAALLHGWQNRDIYGARMAGSIAAVGFKLAGDPSRFTEIETLLRVSKAEVPQRIRLHLNGVELPFHDKPSRGFSINKATVPPGAWACSGAVQYLLVEVDDGDGSETGDISLVALSVGQGAPWADSERPVRHAATRGGRAPLLLPRHENQTARLEMRFGGNEDAGWLTPMSGWSAPEREFRWSHGHQAVLGLKSALALETGVALVTLSGRMMSGPERASQRVAVTLMDVLVLNEEFPCDAQVQIRIALSAEALGGELYEPFILELPDAIAPKTLGFSEDTRELALALMTATFQRMERKIASTIVSIKRSDEVHAVFESVRVAPGQAAVRLHGAGERPNGWFSTLGDQCKRTAMNLASGGWDVVLPLPESFGGVICLTWTYANDGTAQAPLPDEFAAEIWTCSSEGGIEPEPVSIIFQRQMADEGLSAAPISGGSEANAANLLSLPIHLDMTSAGVDTKLLVAGWSYPEAQGTWTDGVQAEIRLPGEMGPVVITAKVRPFLPTSDYVQQVEFSADGHGIATFALNSGAQSEVILVAPVGLTDRIGLSMPGSTAPAELGLSDDARKLGIMLESLSLAPVGGKRSMPEGSQFDDGGHGHLRVDGLSPIPGREEWIVWLVGSENAPGSVSLEQASNRLFPRVDTETSDWIVGVPVPGCALRGETINLSLFAANGADDQPSRLTITLSPGLEMIADMAGGGGQ